MKKYYYLYHIEEKRGVNIKYSESGALILYAKRSSAERAIRYGLSKHFLEETAKKLIVKEIEL